MCLGHIHTLKHCTPRFIQLYILVLRSEFRSFIPEIVHPGSTSRCSPNSSSTCLAGGVNVGKNAGVEMRMSGFFP